MADLTLYDICGEDMSVYARKIDDAHIEVEVKDELERIVYCEKSHPYAWESLVYFANQVIYWDNKMKEGQDAK